MRSRDPFGKAVAGLRVALDQGLAPGQHLPVGDVAAALNLSTSPVREALSRLCGEGLIEDRRGQGYFTRTVPLEDLIGLLDLEAAHVRLAVSKVSPSKPTRSDDAAVEAWILASIEACGNLPLIESFERVHRRLKPLRRVNGPIAAGPPIQGVDAVEAYYDRWRGAAAGLSARLRRLDPTAPEYTSDTV